jgi:hypothetical protein
MNAPCDFGRIGCDFFYCASRFIQAVDAESGSLPLDTALRILKSASGLGHLTGRFRANEIFIGSVTHPRNSHSGIDGIPNYSFVFRHLVSPQNSE